MKATYDYIDISQNLIITYSENYKNKEIYSKSLVGYRDNVGIVSWNTIEDIYGNVLLEGIVDSNDTFSNGMLAVIQQNGK